VNLDNFIDYNVIQIYSANTDWPAHNVYLFRPRTPGGRWHWLFWDSDNGFGADSYSQVDSDMISHLLDYNHPETGGRDVMLFRKLLQNPDFLERFVNRTAGLLNTTLAPESVIGHIDAMAAELAPDIHFETLRWPGPTDWHANVQQMRQFATDRPAYVRQHMVERLGLEGALELNIQPPVEGRGDVAVDGVVLPPAPWQGIYFRPTPVRVTALPAPGFRFAGWEPASFGNTTTITLTAETPSLALAPRFVADGATGAAGDARFTAVHVDDTGDIEGDWFEIRIERRGGLDLRGRRVTDNDTPTADDEGSLIFADRQALARVPAGTTVRIIATTTPANDARFPEDDLNALDRLLVLYAGNGNLDTTTDPWFNLGPRDNLTLLAPDDRLIDFWSTGPVGRASFSTHQ
jgi:hypothetical protein